MKMTWNNLLVVCIVLFTVSACANPEKNISSDEETSFLATLPTTDVNRSLHLSVDGANKPFPFGSEIYLIVNNLSSKSISLDAATHIKLLKFQDNDWVEIENELTYSGEKILSPKGTLLFDTGSIPIWPAIEGTEEVVLRAVVTGEFMKDNFGTGDLVVAYVDINLTP